MNKNKKMIITALLVALSIIIPTQFGFLRVIIPPFTATLTFHVPMFLAMLISPMAGIAVGIGSALGFVITGLPLDVAARAAMHMFVAGIGAVLIRRNFSLGQVIWITAPIHGLLEAIIVIPFGYDFYKSLVIVGIFSVIHHMIDGVITIYLTKAILKAQRKDSKDYRNLFAA